MDAGALGHGNNDGYGELIGVSLGYFDDFAGPWSVCKAELGLSLTHYGFCLLQTVRDIECAQGRDIGIGLRSGRKNWAARVIVRSALSLRLPWSEMRKPLAMISYSFRIEPGMAFGYKELMRQPVYACGRN